MTGLEKFILVSVLGITGLTFVGAPRGWGVFSGPVDVYHAALQRDKRYRTHSTRTGSSYHRRRYHTGGKHW